VDGDFVTSDRVMGLEAQTIHDSRFTIHPS